MSHVCVRFPRLTSELYSLFYDITLDRESLTPSRQVGVRARVRATPTCHARGHGTCTLCAHHSAQHVHVCEDEVHVAIKGGMGFLLRVFVIRFLADRLVLRRLLIRQHHLEAVEGADTD